MLAAIQFNTFFSSPLLSKSLEVITYKVVILPVVLYWCETWSLTLWEEHRPKVFEDRMLRRKDRRGNEITGGWGKLHNEGLHKLYCLPNVIRMIKSRRMIWTGHVPRMGWRRNA
jgi:hypothetical protein